MKVPALLLDRSRPPMPPSTARPEPVSAVELPSSPDDSSDGLAQPRPEPLTLAVPASRDEPRSNQAAHRLTRAIEIHRWVIPIILSILGFGYTIWESIIGDGYPLLAPQVVIGLALLGVADPLLTFVTLTWAARAARSYERAQEARERQHQQLVALNTVGEAVNASLELDTVLNRAIDHVLAMLHLESGELRLIEGARLVLRTARGVSSDFIAAEQSLSVGQCLCGRCAQRGELVAVDSLTPLSDWAQTACNCAHEQFRSLLCVPVRTADRVVGVIHVGSRTPRPFDTGDRALLTAIGQQVGVAIEKAQLLAQLRVLNQQLEVRVDERTHELRAAKEELARHADALRQILVEQRRVEERTRARIAHDLHDGIQQLIIGALFESEAARETILQQPETALARLDDAQTLLRRIESEMRAAIYSLRPLALDMQGLVPALREALASFARVSRVECDLHLEGTPRRFNPDAEIAAFRIVQEALNNVEAHAHARHAHIDVRFGPRALRVEITDDGGGFDTAHIAEEMRTHLGLIGMQERAASVGGTLDLASQVGQGTRITLNLPIHDQ